MSMEQYKSWQKEYHELKKRVTALQLELQVRQWWQCKAACACMDATMVWYLIRLPNVLFEDCNDVKRCEAFQCLREVSEFNRD